MCSQRRLIFSSFSRMSAKHERIHRCSLITSIRRRRIAIVALFVCDISRRNSWIRSAARRFFCKRRLNVKTKLQCTRRAARHWADLEHSGSVARGTSGLGLRRTSGP
jgi:hypothetical protein